LTFNKLHGIIFQKRELLKHQIGPGTRNVSDGKSAIISNGVNVWQKMVTHSKVSERYITDSRMTVNHRKPACAVNSLQHHRTMCDRCRRLCALTGIRKQRQLQKIVISVDSCHTTLRKNIKNNTSANIQ
jgi:hypothetical protein